MEMIWIKEKQLTRTLTRNKAFWKGELEEYPLMWVTVPDAKAGKAPIGPVDELLMWTDIDYVMASAEHQLSSTYFAGDSLPVYNPWLGPDQFAGWLGAELILKPKEFTSWAKPFVDDWNNFERLKINPDNCWWKLYLEIVRASVDAGEGKWVTAYPDLHSGIDALSAIRGPENLMIDMINIPDLVHRAMKQTTQLWKDVVDTVSEIILPAGQGTSNWTMGWSDDHYLCIGQNDFSCMISPQMYEDFCFQDALETCNHADRTIYHLDGPDAARHLPKILELENLDCVQWIQGAGNPVASHWIDMLKQIQDADKSVQVFYAGEHGGDADLFKELDILCDSLDPRRLFFLAVVDTVEKADAVVEHARKICCSKC